MFQAQRLAWSAFFVHRRKSQTAVLICGAAAVKLFHDDFKTKNEVVVDPKRFMADTITPLSELQKNGHLIASKMEMMIMAVQASLIEQLQEIEGKHSDVKFRVDRWQREEGGGGIACVIQDGQVFEKGGVNISVVNGHLPPPLVAQMKSRGKDFGEGPLTFKAMGISSVIHPRNPYVPTLHFNYRYFEVTNAKGELTWWFGGGSDLTPYYIDKDDIRHFHGTLKTACDRHSPKYYPEYKKWCDKYFFINHRYISRGVGGIFFDDLETRKPETALKFVTECATSVAPSYMPLVIKNKDKGYGYRERDWQLIRRGHYAEFNLVYDRGTKFGLCTPEARYEAILMSLPLNARWVYEHQPEPGSPEADLVHLLKNPEEWATA